MLASILEQELAVRCHPTQLFDHAVVDVCKAARWNAVVAAGDDVDLSVSGRELDAGRQSHIDENLEYDPQRPASALPADRNLGDGLAMRLELHGLGHVAKLGMTSHLTACHPILEVAVVGSAVAQTRYRPRPRSAGARQNTGAGHGNLKPNSRAPIRRRPCTSG